MDALLLLLAIAMKCLALIWKYSTDRALLVGMEERLVKVPLRRWTVLVHRPYPGGVYVRILPRGGRHFEWQKLLQ